MAQDSIDLVEDKGQPVKYTVVERSLVGHKIYEAGETAEYEGLPAENLAPTCAIGEARYQRYLETNKQRQTEQREQFAESNGFDQKAFGASVAKAVAEAMAAQRSEDDERIAKIVAAVMAAQKAPETGKGSKANASLA